MSIPFRLDEGIWLEDINEIIRWDRETAELSNFFSPEVVRREGHRDIANNENPTLHLTWKNHICLGLPCDLAATRFYGTPNPRAYHIYLERFHWASLQWQGIPEWSVEEITQHFKQIYEHLRHHLGEATFSYPEYAYTKYRMREGSLPAIFWELPSLQIGFSASFPVQHLEHRKDDYPDERGSAGFSISIQHEPQGYESLKTEAESIKRQSGQGARVDYVAW